MIIQLFKVSFFFDCISNNLDKNTWWTQCALQHIFASKEWKQLHIQKVYFWMNDNPIHFQAYEFQYSLWNLTQQQSSLTFTCKWNYFVEGHGKSICASHSSKVSLALSLWSKQQDHVIDGLPPHTFAHAIFWGGQYCFRIARHSAQLVSIGCILFFSCLFLQFSGSNSNQAADLILCASICNNPVDIAIDPTNDDLYVPDHGNSRVLRFGPFLLFPPTLRLLLCLANPISAPAHLAEAQQD